MSILFTADFQAEWRNLDNCEQAWNEILNICKERKVRTIVVAGDLKQAMNPVDVRVIKWWKSAFSRAVKRKLTVLVLLGNHDRVGAYSNADNWLSIFKRKGVYLFDKPGTHVADNYTLYLLPYTDDSVTRLNATSCKETLSYSAHNSNNILVFHHDLKSAKYNRQGSKSDGNLSSSDLYCDKYKYCIGGHIHFPQRFGDNKNVYY